MVNIAIGKQAQATFQMSDILDLAAGGLGGVAGGAEDLGTGTLTSLSLLAYLC